MKIALCLSGYFANAGGAIGSERGYEYIQRKILDGRDVDVFVHSWDLENEDRVKELYSPKADLFEPQHSFDEELESFQEDWFNEDFDRDKTMYKTNTIYRGLSQLLSRKKAVDLKSEYEKENGFVYDCVILTRFDLGTRGKEHYQVYYATNMNFSDTLDMSYLYSAFWDQFNHGYADHWFFSSSENMNVVANLYDKVFDYYQPSSDYVKAVTEGWPESSAKDEFSNEKFVPKEVRTTDLKRYPRWGCVDNHKLYKWHFISTGLHEKAKYIDITRDF